MPDASPPFASEGSRYGRRETTRPLRGEKSEWSGRSYPGLIAHRPPRSEYQLTGSSNSRPSGARWTYVRECAPEPIAKSVRFSRTLACPELAKAPSTQSGLLRATPPLAGDAMKVASRRAIRGNRPASPLRGTARECSEDLVPAIPELVDQADLRRVISGDRHLTRADKEQ